MTDDKNWHEKAKLTSESGITRISAREKTLNTINEAMAELNTKDKEIAKRRASAKRVAHAARATQIALRGVGAKLGEVVDENEKLYAETVRLKAEIARLEAAIAKDRFGRSLPPRRTDDEEKIYREWLLFQEKLPGLMEFYGGQWVVFKNGFVMDHRSSQAAALWFAETRYGPDHRCVIAKVHVTLDKSLKSLGSFLLEHALSDLKARDVKIASLTAENKQLKEGVQLDTGHGLHTEFEMLKDELKALVNEIDQRVNARTERLTAENKQLKERLEAAEQWVPRYDPLEREEND